MLKTPKTQERKLPTRHMSTTRQPIHSLSFGPGNLPCSSRLANQGRADSGRRRLGMCVCVWVCPRPTHGFGWMLCRDQHATISWESTAACQCMIFARQKSCEARSARHHKRHSTSTGPFFFISLRVSCSMAMTPRFQICAPLFFFGKRIGHPSALYLCHCGQMPSRLTCSFFCLSLFLWSFARRVVRRLRATPVLMIISLDSRLNWEVPAWPSPMCPAWGR